MLKDIHDCTDTRNIRISNVGIADYKLPIVFCSNNEYSTIATFEVGVSLTENQKGAHLSRIIQQLDTLFANKKFKIEYLRSYLNQMKEVIQSDSINFDAKFDACLPIKTPITNHNSFISSKIEINGNFIEKEYIESMAVGVFGAMLCPSSKMISKYGAHSQKSFLTAILYGNLKNIFIEDIVDLMRACFSSEVFGIVKREDEKYMTEKAYENPKFSEDLIRDILLKLNNNYELNKIEAVLKNYESIHEHNVYARGIIQ